MKNDMIQSDRHQVTAQILHKQSIDNLYIIPKIQNNYSTFLKWKYFSIPKQIIFPQIFLALLFLVGLYGVGWC